MRFGEIMLTEANVVNVDDVDKWARAVARDANPAARPWLEKRIRDKLLNFTGDPGGAGMVPIDNHNVKKYAQYPWAATGVERGQPTFFFDPRISELRNAEVYHLIDYLNSLHKVATEDGRFSQEAQRLLAKLPRVTFDQAVEQGSDWFARIQAGADDEFEAAGTREVMRFKDGHRWIEITDARCLDREGNLMQHCVGGGGYDEGLGDGVQIYSLRDPQNHPHVTVEVAIYNEDQGDDFSPETDLHGAHISQVKGKQNAAPVAKYVPHVKALLNSLKLPADDSGARDIEDMGLLYGNGLYGSYRDLGRLLGKWNGLDVIALKLKNRQRILLMNNDAVWFWMSTTQEGLGQKLDMHESAQAPEDWRLGTRQRADLLAWLHRHGALKGVDDTGQTHLGIVDTPDGPAHVADVKEPLVVFPDGSTAYVTEDKLGGLRRQSTVVVLTADQEMDFYVPISWVDASEAQVVPRGGFSSLRPSNPEEREVVMKVAAILDKLGIKRLEQSHWDRHFGLPLVYRKGRWQVEDGQSLTASFKPRSKR